VERLASRSSNGETALRASLAKMSTIGECPEPPSARRGPAGRVRSGRFAGAFGDDRHSALWRADLICIALGSGVLFLVLSLRPPFGSELRYIEAGREMIERGDWIVPHLGYVPYLEKPILAYWAEALCQWLFGLHWIAVRLPSAIASATSLCVTYALARDLRGRAFGLGTSALLLSSSSFLLMGSVMTTDPLFSACLAVAWWAYWRHHRNPASQWAIGFWSALTAAFLTKGPLAVAWVGLSLGACFVIARCARDALSLRPLLGLGILLAGTLAWHIPLWQRDPRFLEFFYWRQNVLAFLRNDVNHAAPVWYYGPVLMGMLFPWSLLLLVGLPAQIARAVAAARGPLGDAARLRLYCVCIVVTGFVLLSASGSKLPTYVLPLAPFVTLLVADWTADRLRGRDRWLVGLFAGQAGALACVAVAAPRVLRHVTARLGASDDAAALGVALVVGAVALASLVCAAATMRSRALAGLTILGVTSVVAVSGLDLTAARLAPWLDGSGLVALLARQMGTDDRVVVDSDFASDYTITLGLRRRVEILGSARELGMGHFTECTSRDVAVPDDPYAIDARMLPQNPWLLDVGRLRKEWRGGSRVWLIAREQTIPRLRSKGLRVYDFGSDATRRIVSNLPFRDDPKPASTRRPPSGRSSEVVPEGGSRLVGQVPERARSRSAPGAGVKAFFIQGWRPTQPGAMGPSRG
jgi:4-amino-4-deoxy-L-arabinose transferase-like glycosyltransferase